MYRNIITWNRLCTSHLMTFSERSDIFIEQDPHQTKKKLSTWPCYHLMLLSPDVNQGMAVCSSQLLLIHNICMITARVT
jgi:hypothetical protein